MSVSVDRLLAEDPVTRLGFAFDHDGLPLGAEPVMREMKWAHRTSLGAWNLILAWK